ncbi:MAG: DUF1003 domain-containing protein [Acidobacteria bacterium]|nr:DUF1003 domain-containing protein [Acidobacteriota bacterium]
MTLEALRSVPLFASLDDGAARTLRELLEVQHMPAGSIIFSSGDVGDAMYLIEGGRVRIHLRDADGDEVTLAELSRGDFFGEMCLLDGKPRVASATVVKDARFAALSREQFLDFLRQHPDVSLKMMGAITERLRRTDELLRHRVSRNLNDESKRRLTITDRLSDTLATFGGSWKFIALLWLLLFIWVYVNTWVQPKPFDEYPYQLLGLVLGFIAGVQAPIIMMSQNRQEEKDRLRADLDYQVNLKNELALAEVLRRLDVLESERLPLLFAEQNARLREQKAEGSR